MSRRRRRRREAPPPAIAAGLLRFFEEELHGMRVRPEIIVLVAVLLIVLSILLNTGFLGLLPTGMVLFKLAVGRARKAAPRSSSYAL